jgi:hypothetical protein
MVPLAVVTRTFIRAFKALAPRGAESASAGLPEIVVHDWAATDWAGGLEPPAHGVRCLEHARSTPLPLVRNPLRVSALTAPLGRTALVRTWPRSRWWQARLPVGENGLDQSNVWPAQEAGPVLRVRRDAQATARQRAESARPRKRGDGCPDRFFDQRQAASAATWKRTTDSEVNRRGGSLTYQRLRERTITESRNPTSTLTDQFFNLFRPT